MMVDTQAWSSTMLDQIIIKVLWWFKPIILWFNKTFTITWTIKKIDFDEFYVCEPLFKKGTVFVTNINGEATNLVNPSKDKHGAIYFGRGLKTHLESLLKQLESHTYPNQDPNHPSILKIKRIKDVLEHNNGPLVPKGIKDEIPYVIEAIGEGVTATSLGKFMTTKDGFKAYNPTFANDLEMSLAADASLHDLGLPYDYGFGDSDEAKYCFEVVIDAYSLVCPNIQFKQGSILGHKYYLANAFTDSPLFDKIIAL